jgi:hypothetical protein
MFCPVYQNKNVEPLPKRLRVQHTSIAPKQIKLLIMVLIVVVIAGWIWLRLS